MAFWEFGAGYDKAANKDFLFQFYGPSVLWNFQVRRCQASKSQHQEKLTLLRFHKGFPAKVNSGKFKKFGRICAKPKPVSKCKVSLKFLNLPLITFAGKPL